MLGLQIKEEKKRPINQQIMRTGPGVACYVGPPSTTTETRRAGTPISAATTYDKRLSRKETWQILLKPWHD